MAKGLSPAIIIALVLNAHGEQSELIPFTVLEQSSTPGIKLMIDVEVALVEGRLPTVEEFRDISK